MRNPEKTEQAGLLGEAQRLYHARAYAQLVVCTEAVSALDLVAEPQLGFWTADALLRTGRPVQGLTIVEALLKSNALLRDTGLALNVYNLHGMLLFETGNVHSAEAAWLQLLQAALEADDQNFAARANNNLGIVYTAHCRHTDAIASYERALAAYQRLGYRRGLAQSHHNLATTYREMGRFADADKYFLTAIEYATADGSEDEIARSELERSISILLQSRDFRMAERTAQRAFGRFDKSNDRGGLADAHRVLGIVAYSRGDYTQASRSIDAALEIAGQIPAPLVEAEALEVLAAVLYRTDRAPAASELRRRATEIFQSLGMSDWGMRQRQWILKLGAQLGADRTVLNL